MHVTAQSIELSDDDGAFPAASFFQRGGKLWALVESISTLAGAILAEGPAPNPVVTIGISSAKTLKKNERRRMRIWQPDVFATLWRKHHRQERRPLDETLP
jgi:hypothetical protein